MDRIRAFTLVELLVVIAIVAIIAAILLPVFGSAKTNAQRIGWVDGSRQVAIGSQLYFDDYDGHAMLPRHRFDPMADAANDRTWVQSLLPYTDSFDIFFCAADSTRPRSASIFDPDLAPGNPSARFYEQSLRTNLGYNYAYLSPVYRQGNAWSMQPRTLSQVESPAGTLLFGDSAWKIENGRAVGGGNYLVIPPCRFEQNADGGITDSFNLNNKANWQILGNGLAWQSRSDLWEAQSGGLYPWFKTTVTVTFMDGHVKSMPFEEVTRGCNVKPNWQGYIYDPRVYIWDLR